MIRRVGKETCVFLRILVSFENLHTYFLCTHEHIWSIYGEGIRPVWYRSSQVVRLGSSCEDTIMHKRHEPTHESFGQVSGVAVPTGRNEKHASRRAQTVAVRRDLARYADAPPARRERSHPDARTPAAARARDAGGPYADNILEQLELKIRGSLMITFSPRAVGGSCVIIIGS